MIPVDNEIGLLLGQAFSNVPSQLQTDKNLLLTALEKTKLGKKTCGEALSILWRMQKVVDDNAPVYQEWRAELHTAWAVYYHYKCPNTEKNDLDEKRSMYHHIQMAQRLEPETQLLNDLIKIILAGRK